MPPAHRNDGFNLIELMIVVAIIATLAAIAVPIYQRHVAKSQIVAAISEITPGRTPYELLIGHSTDPADYTDVSNLGLPADTTRCTISATPAVTGAGSIQCVLKGSAVVAGKTVRLHRDAAGGWRCQSPDLSPSLLPATCTRE